MTGNKQSPKDFDKSLVELEKIVAKMETGNLSLDKMLESFENGITLTRKCQKILDDAEQKIQTLTKKQGKIITSTTDSFNNQEQE